MVLNNLEYCIDVIYILRKFLYVYFEINMMQLDCIMILVCKLDVEIEEFKCFLDWLNKKFSLE